MAWARPLARLALLAGLLAAVALALTVSPLREAYHLDRVAAAVQQIRDRWWAPPLFVAVYALASGFAIPGTALTLAGGAAFGLWRGSLLNYVAANLGASLAFWLARGLGRDGIRTLAGGRIDGVDRIAAQGGFLWLVRLRFIPIVPFNVLNFATGLTAMRWRTFAVATAVGIVPGTVIYTAFADALVAGVRDAGRAAFLRLAAAGVLLLILSFLPALVRRRAGA